MGLYLAIFENEVDIDGVEVGPYQDFKSFRDYIAQTFENGVAGSLYPTLMLHSDCDGEWSAKECSMLLSELQDISARMLAMPAREFSSEWQSNLAQKVGLVPKNALESFLDVDGEPLACRLLELVKRAVEKDLNIVFQ